MEENAIVSQDTFLAPAVTVQAALAAYQAKKDLIENIMREGVDFGTIPGSTKPALYKAGAEKAVSFFGLSVRFSDVCTVEDWMGTEHNREPFIFYRQNCTILRGDRLIASADGSCNSWEKKYRYRWVGESDIPAGLDKSLLKSRDGTISEFAFAIDKAETSGKYGKPPEYWQKFKDAIAANTAKSTKRKTSKGNEMAAWEIGALLYCIPNDEIPDLANTILKMGQKRAFVAATLIATGLSDYYTQDVEDFIQPGETVIDAVAQPVTPAKPEPMPYEQAIKLVAKGKDGAADVVFADMNRQQLEYIVEHSKNADLIDGAFTILEKDYNIARPE
jgi:hypothetical protein